MAIKNSSEAQLASKLLKKTSIQISTSKGFFHFTKASKRALADSFKFKILIKKLQIEVSLFRCPEISGSNVAEMFDF